jgi:hypothetical protein
MVFGFGKRPSNSPSTASHGGDDGTYQQQPPHIRRLIDAMQAIFDDASKLADPVRQGGSLPASVPAEPHLSPIRCKDSETLFEHANEKGEKQYTTYHFTKDFKTVNAAAQYNLYVMYSRIYMANILADKLNRGKLSEAESTELKNAIDEALAKSAYYINYFRSHSLSAALLMNRIGEEDLQKGLDAHGADWVRKMDEAKRAMFRPERLLELVPDRQPVFVFAISEPYQEGQTVINGVYFKREHAEPLLKDAAEEQARAITARGRQSLK